MVVILSRFFVCLEHFLPVVDLQFVFLHQLSSCERASLCHLCWESPNYSRSLSVLSGVGLNMILSWSDCWQCWRQHWSKSERVLGVQRSPCQLEHSPVDSTSCSSYHWMSCSEEKDVTIVLLLIKRFIIFKFKKLYLKQNWNSPWISISSSKI